MKTVALSARRLAAALGIPAPTLLGWIGSGRLPLRRSPDGGVVLGPAQVTALGFLASGILVRRSARNACAVFGMVVEALRGVAALPSRAVLLVDRSSPDGFAAAGRIPAELDPAVVRLWTDAQEIKLVDLSALCARFSRGFERLPPDELADWIEAALSAPRLAAQGRDAFEKVPPDIPEEPAEEAAP